MILPQTHKINKKTLAELATEYANELAARIGSKEKIEIKPEEIIYDPQEAEQLFLPSCYDAGDYERTHVEERVLSNLKNRKPFTCSGVAFIPFYMLSKYEEDLVSEIPGEEQKVKDKSFLKNLFRKKYSFCLLDGFGSEVGHLLKRKLYWRTFDSIGETLDTFSQLYEISLDVNTVYTKLFKRKCNMKQIEGRAINEFISKIRRQTDIQKLLLSKGESYAFTKLSEEGILGSRAEKFINFLQEDYKNTQHFDGAVLFLKLYDNANCNLKLTYKKFGELLSNPNIKNANSALLELGTPADSIHWKF